MDKYQINQVTKTHNCHNPARRCSAIFFTITCLAFFLAVHAPAQTLTFRSSLNIPGSFHTDVWGYVDSNTGNEYAVLGDASGAGVTIVDVSDPDNPVQVSNVSTVPGFDVKVYDHYVYSVTGGGSGQGRILDISNPASPQDVGSFPSSHNIFISSTGYIFSESPGLKIYDLNTNPEMPVEIWSDGSNNGHDASVIGNLLYDFHGTTGTRIYDINNPFNPQLLSFIVDPLIAYHHSGWTSEDGQFLFICDELAQHPTPDITVWDISDYNNPQKIAEYSDPNATIHNLYVVGNYAFVSYYSAGIRVFDISTPSQITVVSEYDTSPLTSGEGFSGAFGVYPFTPSGNIYANDWDNGLFVFSFDGVTGIDDQSTGFQHPRGFELRQNYPNPFNPATTISYHLPEAQTVKLTIYNILGQPVRLLVNETKGAGNHAIEWDGRNNAGQPLGSGVYFYTLSTAGFHKTLKMLKVE